MKSFEKYSEEVLSVVIGSLKKGVSGSVIADRLVSEYGFERKDALTIIVGTLIILG